MKRYILTAILTGATLLAQPVVAPTAATVGRVRGEDVNNYNVVHWFETGYRFHSVDGNRGRYRSDVNFGNGVRLLQSHLTVHSKEGHGRLFDEIALNTQGLGNDPYQSSALRIQRNSLYRYEMNWRINEYVNPGLTTGTLGGHFLNTRRQLQDHQFTLFPQSSFRLFAGYSRNTQDGPGLTSVQLFDSRGDEFPLLAGIGRRQRDYHVGAEVGLMGFHFTVLRGWQQFRESTPYRLEGPSAGVNANDTTTLTSLSRAEPFEGSTPFWRFLLNRETRGWFSANGRFSYAGSRRNFLLEEAAIGTARFGAAQNRQILVAGSGRRPVSTGALTLGFHPGQRFTLANHTAFHQVLMDGDSVLRDFNNATQLANVLRFQSLGIRTVTNSTDALFWITPQVALYGGHRFSTRRIRSREGFASGTFSELFAATQQNRLHSGVGGLRLHPTRAVSISLDSEIGRADQPFTPVAERNYHALGGRAQYKTKSLLLAASARANYNFNSANLFRHSSRSRNYSLDASWTGRSWISFDASYSKLHLDTLTGIAYFAAFEFLETDRSFYASNIHAGTATVRLSLPRNTDLFLGYSRVQDVGDGRAAAARQPAFSPVRTGPEAFRIAQTFPMSYDSPLSRLSVRLHDKLRWNFGYQFYRYGEDFTPGMGYRAHTGYSSLLWSF